MKKLLILFVLIFEVTYANAQADGSNNLVISVSTSPNFTLNTATLLENAQSITNAFYIGIKTGRRACNVYVSVPSGITTTQPTSMPVGNIELTYRSTTCDGAHLGTITSGTLPMTTSNQFLFSQKSTATQYKYYYDVNIPAIGYTYNPGTYNYTFQFTMTQP